MTGSGGGLQFQQANAADPTSSSVLELYRSGTDVYWWNGTAGSKLNGQSGGGGGSSTLDQAYELGRAVALDLGAVAFTDATTGALHSMSFAQTGAKSGDVINIAVTGVHTGSAVEVVYSTGASTGDAINLNMGTNLAGQAIEITSTGARTGDLVYVNDDSSGAHNVFSVDAAGAGAAVGYEWTGSYNGSPAGQVFKVTFDANDNLDTELMEVTTGAGNRNIIFDLNFGHTDSGTTSHIFDIDVTGLLDSNVFDIAFGTAASTGDAISIAMGTNLAGSAIVLNGTGVRTDDLIKIDDDSTGNAHIFDINVTGIYTGNVLDITFATAAATGHAISITTGTNLAGNAMLITTAGVRTAPVIYIDGAATDGGTDDHVIFINQTGLLDSNLIQLTFATAASTGDAIGVSMGTNLAGSALVLNGTGARTDDLIKIDDDSTGSAHIFDINISGIYTGNVLDIAFATAAATGHAINITTGTNLAGNAILITTAGARTAPVIYIDGVGTDGGTDDHIFFVNQTGQLDSNIIQLTYATAASTGDAIGVTMGTNVAGSALVISGAGARTDDLIKIDDDGTGNSHIFDINLSGIYTGNVIDIAYSVAAVTGSMFKGVLGTGVGAMAFEVTGTGVRTADVFDYTSDQTGAALIFDINLTGAASGNVFDVTFSTGAYSGNAIDLNMGTNVAGDAINISSAGTADGCIMDVSHTGNLAAGTSAVKIVSTGNWADGACYLFELEQNTGAGVAGASVLKINAAGTNVEAIEIEAGVLFEAEITATAGAGNGETLPITGNTIFYDPNGGSRTGVIVTAGLRDGQRVTIVNIADAAETITFAAFATSNVAGGVSVSIAQFECLTLLWNSTRALWYCMGAGL